MKTEVTRIPLASVILKGGWSGIVYLIVTEETTEREHTEQEHKDKVDEVVAEIIRDYDQNNHYTVSLRETRREMVHSNTRMWDT